MQMTVSVETNIEGNYGALPSAKLYAANTNIL